jgi:hypothetical protein
MSALLPRIVIDNDTPQRLGVVAAQFGLTLAALRAEARRGRLVISRVAGKDWTSVAEAQRMFNRCRVMPEALPMAPARSPASRRRRSTLWIIRDAGHQRSTGFGQSNRREAEKALADCIADKYAPARRERDIAEIPVPEVINIYLADVAPNQARPEKAAERCGRILEFFGERCLSEVTGANCRPTSNRADQTAARGATFKTLLRQSAIMPRRACIVASSESPCLREGRPASGGLRETRSHGCCRRAGATARFRKGSRPTSGRCATWPALSSLASTRAAGRARFSMRLGGKGMASRSLIPPTACSIAMRKARRRRRSASRL